MADAEPRITPPPALGPPIIGTDTAGSAPGITQPVIVSGGVSLPPSFPIAPAGTWIPPASAAGGVGTIANPVGPSTFPPTGTNTAPVTIPATTPAPTPVVPPGTGINAPTQPVFATGSATAPHAGNLAGTIAGTMFPSFSAAGPFQPIVLTAIMNTSLATSQVPMTPGTQPITIMTALVNTTPPVIEGEPNVGETLELTAGVWNGPANKTYQWMSDGVAIPGATGETYEVQPSDEGNDITVVETATNLMGSGTATSNAIGPIEPPMSTPVIPPIQSGEPETLGERLHLPGAGNAKERSRRGKKR